MSTANVEHIAFDTVYLDQKYQISMVTIGLRFEISKDMNHSAVYIDCLQANA